MCRLTSSLSNSFSSNYTQAHLHGDRKGPLRPSSYHLQGALCSYHALRGPNCIILAITPANQDVATSDAIKLAREVDPNCERTFGVLTKLDLMDWGTNALDVLEGRSYQLQHPWVGMVNRSQADINRNVDMLDARCREHEFFATNPDYGHLARRMGSEYLAKLLSKQLESVIKARMPGIMSLINQSINELEAELNHLGRTVAVDAGVGSLYLFWQAQLYTILELCCAFDRIFKEHLDGGNKETNGFLKREVSPKTGSIVLVHISKKGKKKKK